MDDYEGLLDLPRLADKVSRGEYESKFQIGDVYSSRDLANNDSHGTTLYFGSRKSLMHFCFYQKNYEQRRKKHIELEDSPIINRYELRFRHEKAQLLASKLARNDDFETMIFEIINNSLCFYDRLPKKKNAKVDKEWANFIGNHGELSLSLKSEAMSFEKSIRWLIHGVAPTLKFIDSVSKLFKIDYLDMMIDSAELGDSKQKMLDAMTENPEWFTEEAKIYEQLLKEKQKKQSTSHTP